MKTNSMVLDVKAYLEPNKQKLKQIPETNSTVPSV